jgi:hypothetical protein
MVEIVVFSGGGVVDRGADKAIDPGDLVLASLFIDQSNSYLVGRVQRTLPHVKFVDAQVQRCVCQP